MPNWKENTTIGSRHIEIVQPTPRKTASFQYRWPPWEKEVETWNWASIIGYSSTSLIPHSTLALDIGMSEWGRSNDQLPIRQKIPIVSSCEFWGTIIYQYQVLYIIMSEITKPTSSMFHISGRAHHILQWLGTFFNKRKHAWRRLQ